MNAASACVLVACYNGQPYLSAQLESIFQMLAPGWHVYIRDDHSSDGTVEAISHYSERGECVWLQDTAGRLRPLGNFSCLMQKAYDVGEVYFFLSDQDDIWSHDKLVLQMAYMQEMERLYPGKPVLIHSDMEVVDASLQTIAPSFMHYQGIRHECSDPLHVLLSQNFVTGCTVMVNRALLDIALPIPEDAAMHDWWLALCAAVFGHIGYIDEALVQYRQHANNEVGAKHFVNYINPVKTNWWSHWQTGRKNLLKSVSQAKVLAKRIREKDPENPNLELIESYARLPDLSPWQRVKVLRRNHIHMQSLLRQWLMLSRVIFLPKVHHE